MYYWLSEPFLYLGYAILAAISVLAIVPDRYKPRLAVPAWLGPLAALAVAVGGFIPLLRIVMFFKSDLGFWKAFNSIMFQFREGEQYAWLLVLAILMAVLAWIVQRNPRTITRFLMLPAVLGMAWGLSGFNHAATLFDWLGPVAFLGHFAGMAFWTGTLLLVGWFSLGSDRWDAFLRWFHPFAILCFVIVMASGLYLMSGVAPDPVNSWGLSYGQALLVKHILILPLLVFAFVNGALMKRKLRRESFYRPASWARSEGVLIWLIYIVTGYMNQQAAPMKCRIRSRFTGLLRPFCGFIPDSRKARCSCSGAGSVSFAWQQDWRCSAVSYTPSNVIKARHSRCSAAWLPSCFCTAA